MPDFNTLKQRLITNLLAFKIIDAGPEEIAVDQAVDAFAAGMQLIFENDKAELQARIAELEDNHRVLTAQLNNTPSVPSPGLSEVPYNPAVLAAPTGEMPETDFSGVDGSGVEKYGAGNWTLHGDGTEYPSGDYVAPNVPAPIRASSDHEVELSHQEHATEHPVGYDADAALPIEPAPATDVLPETHIG